MRGIQLRERKRSVGRRSIPGLVEDEQGQAISEYLILLFAVGLVCISFSKLLPEAIRGYVRPIYYSVAKPFP